LDGALTVHLLADIAPAAASAPGLSINFFWVIVAALNFIFFLVLIWLFAFKPIASILSTRQARIEQGLTDAALARKERDAAAAERERLIAEARRESQALIATAQKAAQDLRDADIAATREELGRLHEKAAADIVAERDRAMADLRTQVADLALAAARVVVGETMTEPRQRRLVEEYLAERNANDGRRN
jgi:F-type H+-transporting ATPase subunit b